MATMARDLGRQGARNAAGASSAAATELAAAAQRAQTFAGGSGAAVLSVEAGELVCRAISGSSPAVGTRFPLTASFPGLCVKDRKPLKCDEAETDTRVEKGAYVALKIKSIVVVPIMQQQNAVGVLAVFSGSASAFHNTHIAILRTMADSTLAALQTVRQEEAGAAPAIDGATAEAPAQQATPVIPEFVVSPGVGVQPNNSVPAAAATQPKAAAPVQTPRPTTVVPPAPRPPVKPPAPLMQPVGEPVSQQSLGKKEEIVSLAADVGPRSTKPRATPTLRPTPPARPMMNRPTASPARRYRPPQQKSSFLPFALAAMLLAAIVAGAWGLHTRRAKPIVGQQESARSGGQQAISAAAARSAPVPEPVEVADTQQSDNTAVVRDVATAELGPTVASGSIVAKHEPVLRPVTKSTQHVVKEVAGGRTEHKPVPPPAAGASATPQPALISVKPPAPIPVELPAEAPQKMALLPSTAPVPALVKSAPASLPTLAPVKTSQTTPAEIINRVPPRYPPLALSSHLTGTVTVAATVSKEGRVTAVQVVSGPPLFREAATSAVKQWRFKPATVNGMATESTANIVLKFTNGGR